MIFTIKIWSKKFDPKKKNCQKIEKKIWSYLLLLFVQLRELTQKTDQRSFSKGVVHTGVKGQSWIFAGENVHPSARHPNRHEIAFVQNEDEMFVPRIFSQMIFYVSGSRSHGISGVQHFHDDVRAVQHFVELSVDAVALPFGEDRVRHGRSSSIVNLRFIRVSIHIRSTYQKKGCCIGVECIGVECIGVEVYRCKVYRWSVGEKG